MICSFTHFLSNWFLVDFVKFASSTVCVGVVAPEISLCVLNDDVDGVLDLDAC